MTNSKFHSNLTLFITFPILFYLPKIPLCRYLLSFSVNIHLLHPFSKAIKLGFLLTTYTAAPPTCSVLATNPQNASLVSLLVIRSVIPPLLVLLTHFLHKRATKCVMLQLIPNRYSVWSALLSDFLLFFTLWPFFLLYNTS